MSGKKLSNSRVKGDNPDKIAARNIKAETNDADKELNNLEVKFRPGARTGNDMMPGGAPANEFPARFTEVDDRDHLIALKASLIEGANGATPFGQAQLTDEDLKWIDDKRKIAQYLDLQSFIENFYDIKDPAHRALIKDLYPEYFERRLEYLKQMSELQMKLAEIQLYGPRNRQDLHVLYEISTGAIPLPRGALWNPSSWHDREEMSLHREFQRGLLNPKRLHMRNPAQPGEQWELAGLGDNERRTMTNLLGRRGDANSFTGRYAARNAGPWSPLNVLERVGIMGPPAGALRPRRLVGF